MNDNHAYGRRAWRMPNELWEWIEPLLPPRKLHPLECHRPRMDDRQAMDAIFVVRRTGCQGNALHHTGIGSRSAAHRRFQEWSAAGVCLKVWRSGLAAYEVLNGSDGEWLAMDGAMTKAPLGGEQSGPEPDRAREDRHQAERAHRRRRRPYRPGGRRGQSQ
jgi:transposase